VFGHIGHTAQSVYALGPLTQPKYMAVADVKFVKCAGPTMVFNSEDWTAGAGTVTKQPGDVVKRGDTGGNFATIVLDGDIEVGTDIGLGIVRKAST
jgi:hypothetical protein